MIYLDNAASTWPKPVGVADAVKQAIEEYGANPGRSSHRLATKAAQSIAQTRYKLSQLFGVRDPANLLFCLNTTHALNMALKGMLRAGDHLIMTGLEHHAVARQVAWMRQYHDIAVSIIRPQEQMQMEKQMETLIQANTRLIVTIHGSNVTGEVLPIEEIGYMAQKHRIPYLVDAAQTVGLLPLQLDDLPVDLLAFPGHKGLFGPQGTGGLYVAPHVSLFPLFQGGTGSHSEELMQPLERPLGFESGTPNTPGIAGLGVGVQFILETGMAAIYGHEMNLVNDLWVGLQQIDSVEMVTQTRPVLPLLSFRIEGMDSIEVATILDQYYQIGVRAGFHCAVLAHQHIGTADTGAIRVSPGYFNTSQEIEQFIQAIQEIAKFCFTKST
jgi:cysteine desulfurase family protein